jgi:hypothetical protein
VCLTVCDVETSKMRRPRLELGCSATQKNVDNKGTYVPATCLDKALVSLGSFYS